MRLALIWLVIVVLGGGAGLAVAKSRTALYSGTLDIQYIVSNQDASDFLRVDRDLTTQAVLLTSRAVLGPVAEANGVPPEELTKRVTATILSGGQGGSGGQEGSELIEVVVLDADPATATRLANAIGDQYLKIFKAASPASYLQGQLDKAKQQLIMANPTDAAALQSRITTLQGQLDVETIAGNQASVAVPAFASSAPVYPNSLLAVATGLFCGIVVACLVAIGISRRWTRG